MLVVGWVLMVQRMLLQDSTEKEEVASGREILRVERIARWDSWPRQHCALRYEDFPVRC